MKTKDDYAPGSLLVSEAGGKVANIGSTKYDFKNLDFIAANKALYDEWTKGEDAIFPIKIK
jgi:fructose-1,6-bisphosphatase/inositol monophosphatase family enzyme